jgi:hypothetical protein
MSSTWQANARRSRPSARLWPSFRARSARRSCCASSTGSPTTRSASPLGSRKGPSSRCSSGRASACRPSSSRPGSPRARSPSRWPFAIRSPRRFPGSPRAPRAEAWRRWLPYRSWRRWPVQLPRSRRLAQSGTRSSRRATTTPPMFIGPLRPRSMSRVTRRPSPRSSSVLVRPARSDRGCTQP